MNAVKMRGEPCGGGEEGKSVREGLQLCLFVSLIF